MDIQEIMNEFFNGFMLMALAIANAVLGVALLNTDNKMFSVIPLFTCIFLLIFYRD